MPRPPKANKDKAPVAPAPVMPVMPMPAMAPHPVLEVDNFIRVRDSTLGRLKTIQRLIESFAEDYLRQTNLLLGLPTPDMGIAYNEPLANLEASLAALGTLPPAPQFAPPIAEEQKKERKKRTLDPNAPKRPLTPYFLYMQTARPIIANDLGSTAPKKAVQEEGQRRWATMHAEEKHGWNQAYAYNLRLYNARVHSYKGGNPEAKEMSDDEALAYADANEIALPAANDDYVADANAAIAEQLQGTAGSASEETPASKPAKKAASGRKRKTDTAPEEAPATPASPVQKRRRTSTKAAAAAEENQEPKKSGRKKGGKNA